MMLLRNRFLVVSALLLMAANLCESKSLLDYGIHNEEIEKYLEEVGLNYDSSIELLIRSEETGEASGFYGAVWTQIYHSENVKEIKKLTELFVTGINSKSKSYVLNRLWRPPFREGYFTNEAQRTLRNVENPNAFKADYIRVLGLADVDHSDIDLESYVQGKTLEESLKLPEILEVVGNAQRFKSSAWAARVVLSRRGDGEALSGLVEKVRDMDLLELRSSRDVLMDLGYVAQEETIKFLEELLFSDLGTPSNPYPEGIFEYPSRAEPAAFMALQPLAIAFVDFPVDYWKSRFTIDDLEIARNYMRNRKGSTRQNKAEVDKPQPDPTTVQYAENTAEIMATEESSDDDEAAKKAPPLWLWLLGALVLVGSLFVLLRRKE